MIVRVGEAASGQTLVANGGLTTLPDATMSYGSGVYVPSL